MQSSILGKLSVPPIKNWKELFEIKNFLTCDNRFFTKIFLPHFGRWDANVMTWLDQLAPKQITNL